MEQSTHEFPPEHGRALAITRASLDLLWRVVRFPIACFMTLAAPIVTVLLTCLSLFAFVCAFLYKSSAAGSHFSFWWMIAASLICAMLIFVVNRVLAFLTR